MNLSYRVSHKQTSCLQVIQRAIRELRLRWSWRKTGTDLSYISIILLQKRKEKNGDVKTSSSSSKVP